nr:hypothetical protein [Tanacetum cinerariifolium]
MKKIVLRRADLNEHVIAEQDFNDGTLLQIDEALDYRVKEFRINRLNPGLNMRFWTRKDVDQCNAFMFAIQRRLRTRRIFRNLESFVGGRVAVCSSLRSPKSKRTIESRAKRSSKKISLGHDSTLLASSHTVKMKIEILLEPTSNKLLVVGFNSLVHSLRALSALRLFGLRTASTAAKPCQGDSSEFYLITGNIHTDQRGTVVDVSNSSPLVSPSTTINVPHVLNSIDVAATFRVPLSTVSDLYKLINDTEAGKHDELLSGMTNDDRMETLDALGSICNSIHANRNYAYVIPCKVSHADDSINLDVDESTIPSDPIIQSMDINTKSTSYAGAAGVMNPPIVTTSNVITPHVEKTNDGFQTVGKKKKRKGKSKSTNAGQFTSPSVKQNVRYEQKATTTAPKMGATYMGNTSQSSSVLKTTGNSSKKDNLSMSNSFSALNDEEDVEIVHDESDNLNTKAGGSLSFMVAAG